MVAPAAIMIRTAVVRCSNQGCGVSQPRKLFNVLSGGKPIPDDLLIDHKCSRCGSTNMVPLAALFY